MDIKPLKTYEFVITETRTYTVQGSGRSKFDAEQDAIVRFHRLTKSNDIVCDEISKPRVIRILPE
jgi:hypothetical protein